MAFEAFGYLGLNGEICANCPYRDDLERSLDGIDDQIAEAEKKLSRDQADLSLMDLIASPVLTDLAVKSRATHCKRFEDENVIPDLCPKDFSIHVGTSVFESVGIILKQP